MCAHLFILGYCFVSNSCQLSAKVQAQASEVVLVCLLRLDRVLLHAVTAAYAVYLAQWFPTPK
jgi:hypothetical protein